jgi:hypothetical protein
VYVPKPQAPVISGSPHAPVISGPPHAPVISGPPQAPEIIKPKITQAIKYICVPSHACSASACDESIQMSKTSDIKAQSRPKPKDIPTSVPTPIISSRVPALASNAWAAQQQKIAKKQAINDEKKTKALAHNLGKGIDLHTYKTRAPTDTECLMTVYSEGHVTKNQLVGDLWFILPKGKTLVYYVKEQKYTIMKPEEAEALDDKEPNTYFCCDAVGCKRSYKFVYSMRHCPSFLSELQYRCK